jgi:hypothetical protein
MGRFGSGLHAVASGWIRHRRVTQSNTFQPQTMSDRLVAATERRFFPEGL